MKPILNLILNNCQKNSTKNIWVVHKSSQSVSRNVLYNYSLKFETNA